MNTQYSYSLSFYPLLIFLSCNCLLKAQSLGIPEAIQLETITVPGGNESNMVNRMMQDPLGFIWFPTPVGLYRYDGTRFRAYPLSNNGDPEYIEHVLVDKNGNYWAASYHNGLFRFDPISGSFEHFLFEEKVEGGESPNQIFELSEGPDGRIWMATRNGILVFDPGKEAFKHYSKIKIGEEQVPLGLVQNVLTGHDGNLWFGVGDPWQENRPGIAGLLRFVAEENEFEAFYFDHTEKSGINALNISSLYQDREGYIWVGVSGQKLYRFDPRLETYQLHNVRWQNISRQAERKVITGITEDCYGRIWLAVTYEGLYCYDPQSGASRHFLPAPGRPNDTYANNAFKIMTTSEGDIWVSNGTVGPFVVKKLFNGNGLLKFLYNSKIP